MIHQICRPDAAVVHPRPGFFTGGAFQRSGRMPSLTILPANFVPVFCISVAYSWLLSVLLYVPGPVPSKSDKIQ